MQPWFETVTDLCEQADVLRRRPYGLIEMRDERLLCIRLRPLPKMISLAHLYWAERWYHRVCHGNRCLLYYNQPRRLPTYLALKYVVSPRGTTLRTFRGALVVLDEIARLKGCDALVCDAANLHISDRLLARWGWEPHAPRPWHRNFIKRFYGTYPSPDEAWGLMNGWPPPGEACPSGTSTTVLACGRVGE